MENIDEDFVRQSEEEAEELKQQILQELSELKKVKDDERAFIEALMALQDTVQSMSGLVLWSREQTVEQWRRDLRHVPDEIGDGEGYSIGCVMILQHVSGSIRQSLDNWIQEAGISLFVNGYSEKYGIKLLDLDDSGISLDSVQNHVKSDGSMEKEAVQ